MPSNFTLQNTVNWLAGLIEQQPVLINGMEPALSSGSLVKQVILGPPMAWPWNRGTVSFTTSDQDTTIANLNDFGFLEGGSVQAGATAKPMALQVKNVMQIDESAARPQFVSPYMDDGYGNITFRLIPAPDPTISYTINLIYQRSSNPMQSMAALWYPIPDDLVYIPNWGMLAMMSLIGNDGRFSEYNAKFVTAVLGQQGGLDAMERAIFMGNWNRALAESQSVPASVSERYRARES